MKRDSLDTYDVLPEDMIAYLSNYGRHFNRKLVEFAIGLMHHKSKESNTLLSTKDSVLDKDKVNDLLNKYGIKLENNQLYDHVYVANMCKNDFLRRSVPDEAHMAMYIKDVIDDEDGYDGIVFNRWYADTRRKGISIDWEEML